MFHLILTFAASTVFASSALTCQPPVDNCYRNNNIGNPERNLAIAPRCWFKESETRWSCFEENKDGSCDAREALSSFDFKTCELNECESEPQTIEPIEPQEPIDEDCQTCPPLELGCFRGNVGIVPELNQLIYPSCWFEEAPGRWGCYNPINNSCNGIKGLDMIDIRSCSKSTTPNVPFPSTEHTPTPAPYVPTTTPSTAAQCPTKDLGCFHGNMDDHFENKLENYPSCWQKVTPNRWACYNPIKDDTCSGIFAEDLIDIRRCPGFTSDSKPNTPILPEVPTYTIETHNVPVNEQPTYKPQQPIYYPQQPANDQSQYPIQTNGTQYNTESDYKKPQYPQIPTRNSPNVTVTPVGSNCPQFEKGCFHGNEDQAYETNPKNFPSCWFKELSGRYGCYNPIDNKCKINGHDMIDIRNCPKFEGVVSTNTNTNTTDQEVEDCPEDIVDVNSNNKPINNEGTPITIGEEAEDCAEEELVENKPVKPISNVVTDNTQEDEECSEEELQAEAKESQAKAEESQIEEEVCESEGETS